jgi:hypothetical protein
VEVAPTIDPKKPETEELVSVKISRGILHATYKERQTQVYNIANRNEQARDIIIEHPKQAGWHVVVTKSEKPPKETRDVPIGHSAAPQQQHAGMQAVHRVDTLAFHAGTRFQTESWKLVRLSQPSRQKATFWRHGPWAGANR